MEDRMAWKRRMKPTTQKLTALLLAFALCLTAWSTYAGGRDIPDSEYVQRGYLYDLDVDNSIQQPVKVTIGGIEFEIGVDDNGHAFIRPVLFGEIGRLWNTLVGSILSR